MTSTADKPIDTHLIGIVYDAIRRDLGRAFDTLSTPIDARRRVLLRTTSSGLLPFSAATTPVRCESLASGPTALILRAAAAGRAGR